MKNASVPYPVPGYIRQYVTVRVDFNDEGIMLPRSILWSDGREYPIDRVKDIRSAPALKAGGLVGADLGFLYVARNSNNPAQGRLGIDVSASAGGKYKFRIRKLPVQISYQADLPLMGCMFSPQFGQSYYDISEGSRDHNACFSYPGNALSFRHLLTMDLEFSRASLRFGYMGDVRQSHVNGIRMHDINHSFMIGYVRYLKLLKRNER